MTLIHCGRSSGPSRREPWLTRPITSNGTFFTFTLVAANAGSASIAFNAFDAFAMDANGDIYLNFDAGASLGLTDITSPAVEVARPFRRPLVLE